MSTHPSDDPPLRESEQKYRRLVEGLAGNYLIYTHAPDGRITYVTPSVQNVLGLPPGSVVGLNWRDIVGKHFVEPTEVTQGKICPQFTVEIQRIDGETRSLEVQQQPWFGPHGEYLAMEGIAKDITDLKLATEMIRKKEAHLAHVSRLATMGALVAGIAHEVNQPLHAAKTFAEAARRNLEAGHPKGITTAIDCTKEISDAITRTAKIIRHLRAFTSAKPAEMELLNINNMVQDAAEIIAHETRRARIQVRFDLASQRLPVQGDRMQLEQACVNLLINAYEAMNATASDQREVLISTRGDHREAKILFRDLGCGIPPEDQDKLFDAFHSTKLNGLGMGLSLCKSIAESHGGGIGAQPNEGPGMTFVLTLPLSKTPEKKSLGKKSLGKVTES